MRIGINHKSPHQITIHHVAYIREFHGNSCYVVIKIKIKCLKNVFEVIAKLFSFSVYMKHQ